MLSGLRPAFSFYWFNYFGKCYLSLNYELQLILPLLRTATICSLSVSGNLTTYVSSTIFGTTSLVVDAGRAGVKCHIKYNDFDKPNQLNPNT